MGESWRRFGEAEAGEVYGDIAEALFQKGDGLTVDERPGRISVHE